MSQILHYVFRIFVTMTFVSMVVAHDWIDAHATFYGDNQGRETEFGACGYDVHKNGYGLATTALSTSLFEDGAKCGACFEIKCVNSPQGCVKGAGPIMVTATNLCPPSNGPTPWCNPPKHHFDLSQPMYLKIAHHKAGIVPVKYRRVPCVRKGGIKFELTGNPHFLLVLVYNVGGAGDVKNMKIKGSSPGWVEMKRNWGMKWHVNGVYTNQGLSFQVTSSNGKTVQLNNVVPPSWQFGQTFHGKNNF